MFQYARAFVGRREAVRELEWRGDLEDVYDDFFNNNVFARPAFESTSERSDYSTKSLIASPQPAHNGAPALGAPQLGTAGSRSTRALPAGVNAQLQQFAWVVDDEFGSARIKLVA